MKGKLRYILIPFVLLLIGFYIWHLWLTDELHLKTTSFDELPGWKTNDARKSLQAFQVSCRVFLKQNPEKSVGSQLIELKAKDWQPICKIALRSEPKSDKKSREFFETWFTPVAFHKRKPLDGLFTGYYMPVLKGSLTKTKQHDTPIYGFPTNMISVDLSLFDPNLKHHRRIVGQIKGNTLIPYFTREDISKGAIEQFAPVIAWINNRVDRQFLEIEGSGVIELTDGKKLFLGYAGQNGAPYTSIAQVLIDRGVMTKDNASMQRIREYFKTHPDQVESVLNQNKSFVFFNTLPHEEALGAQGVGLTPGYSLAIDRKWIPLGVPIWLNTTRPVKIQKDKLLQRLMIAQDTGGAIRGPVRGDVYWGTGEEAIYVAGRMKNQGHYWLLLPKHTVDKL